MASLMWAILYFSMNNSNLGRNEICPLKLFCAFSRIPLNGGHVTSSDRSVLWEYGDWDHVNGLWTRASNYSAESQLQQSWQSGGIPFNGEQFILPTPCSFTFVLSSLKNNFNFDLLVILYIIQSMRVIPVHRGAISLSRASGGLRFRFWWLGNTEVIPDYLYHFFAFILC